jgi:hypothetical protein
MSCISPCLRASVRAGVRVLGVVALLAGLVLAGRGPLATPPLWRPAALPAWLAARGGLVAGVALVRLLALGLGGYLAAAAVLAAALRAVGQLRAAAALERLGAAALLRAMGVGLAVAAPLPEGVLLAAALAPAAAAQPVAAAQPLAPARPVPAPDLVAAHRPPTASPAGRGGRVELLRPPPLRDPPTPVAGPRLCVLEPARAGPARVGTAAHRAPTPAAVRVPATAAAAVRAAAGPAGASRVPATVTLRPGDSFWSVAEDVVEHALGREPTDEEVAPYWLALVAANRSRLADPAVPDLVFPGQVLVLPSQGPMP